MRLLSRNETEKDLFYYLMDLHDQTTCLCNQGRSWINFIEWKWKCVVTIRKCQQRIWIARFQPIRGSFLDVFISNSMEFPTSIRKTNLFGYFDKNQLWQQYFNLRTHFSSLDYQEIFKFLVSVFFQTLTILMVFPL